MKHLCAGLLGLCFFTPSYAEVSVTTGFASTAARASHTVQAEVPLIEIAILLDTSGSMGGLINQARTHLWGIVNTMALARKGQQQPQLRVSLYEYGNSRLSPEGGWVQQVLPLTNDLDGISEALFALTTSGGNEYCGQALAHAVDQLSWTSGSHYRAVFIAGNEEFTQGSVAYTLACSAAVGKDIHVNTIHCGDAQSGRSGMWVHAAEIGGGSSININQGKTYVAIIAPQDDQLKQLNDSFNKTYIPYGATGKQNSERQALQDSHALSNGSLGSRIRCKSGTLYDNRTWDLVDACNEKDFDIRTIKKEELPKKLQTMDIDECKKYIEQKNQERARLQKEIAALSQEREIWVAQERVRLAGASDKEDTFDTAMRTLLETQLQQTGYTLVQVTQ